jgi:hypothetical protein
MIDDDEDDDDGDDGGEINTHMYPVYLTIICYLSGHHSPNYCSSHFSHLS